jgi:hypothetical protein
LEVEDGARVVIFEERREVRRAVGEDVGRDAEKGILDLRM